MIKKNIKLQKLIKYYSLINHNLIFSDKAINRYKQQFEATNQVKLKKLKALKENIQNIKNCNLKKVRQISFLVTGIQTRKL